MKYLRVFVFGLAAALLLVVVVGFALPSAWLVEREITIRAAPEAVHPHIAEFRHWPEWNPCLRDDPAMIITYEGAPGSIGSIMRWKSEKLGNGSVKLTESDPKTGMHYELLMEEFSEPARGSITLEADGTASTGSPATKVHWKDTGDVGSNPVMKICLPIVVEPMMKKYFARGLEQLKENVEVKR